MILGGKKGLEYRVLMGFGYALSVVSQRKHHSPDVTLREAQAYDTIFRCIIL